MVEKHLKNDYDEESLIAVLQLLPTIFEEECPPINLEDVVKVCPGKTQADSKCFHRHQNYFDKRIYLCNTREIFFDVEKNKNMAALENVSKKT